MLSRFWLFVVFAAAFDATPAHAETPKRLDVVLDQAVVAKLPAGAATLIIGNPTFADVTMLKTGGAMVVTGKAFGQTNLIALDGEGAVLLEEQVRVLPARTVVVLQSGVSRVSYACNPDCMPTVQLGDDDDHFGKTGAQISARNALAHGDGSANASAGK